MTASAAQQQEIERAGESGTPDQPVSGQERIVALDFIRGIAVLGILFPNIVAYGHPFLAYYWPEALPGGATPFDRYIWLFQFVLIDGKLRGLFTLLFGAGVYLFMERVWARGGTAVLQARRLGWLGLLGLAHTFLLWTGDILVLYAAAGFGALLMLDWPAKTQLRVGIAWFLAGALLLSALLAGQATNEMAPGLADGTAQVSAQARQVEQDRLNERKQELEVTRSGDYGAVVRYHLREEGPGLPEETLFFVLIETLPLMLVGMALYRLGLFEGRFDRRKMKRWGWAGLIGGGVLALPLGLWPLSAGFPLALTEFVFNGPAALLHLPMMLGLLSLFALWAPSASRTWLGSRFVAAGRMAFSNYLGTSLVMLFVFQHWAGGLFGELHRVQLLLVMLAAWALMLAWSKPWLARFRYGPLEWLWRCLTYWTLVPFRR